MSKLCFLCSKEIDGDEQYYEFHLNKCLDDQRILEVDTSVHASGSGSSNRQSMEDYEEDDSVIIMTPLPRRRKVDEEQDRDVALALSLQLKEDAVVELEVIDQGKKCIICQLTWEQLAINPILNREATNDHVLSCLESSNLTSSISTSSSSSKNRQKQINPNLYQSQSQSQFKINKSKEIEVRDFEEQLQQGCPSCGRTWNQLSINLKLDLNWDIRVDHIDSCDGLGGEINEDGGRGGQEDGVGNYYELGTGKGKLIRGTDGLIPILSLLLTKSHLHSRTKTAYLCTSTIQHIQTLFTDFGWGCGYRNLQMLFSSLRELNCYKSLYAGKEINSNGVGKGKAPIPTILECQEILEMAWRTGYDPAAASHFKNKLKGTRKWIGTTEVYTAFIWLGIRTRIVDFPCAAGKGSNSSEPHEVLIQWIQNYFEGPSPSSDSSSPNSSKRPFPSSSTSTLNQPINALEVLMESKGIAIKMTNKQPLFLQHQGHSRTVVGFEIGKNGESSVLMFDPSKYPKQPLREAAEKLLVSNASAISSSKRLKLSPSPPPPTAASTSNAFWSQQPGKGTGIAPPASGSGTNSIRNGFGFKKSNGSNETGGLDTNNYTKFLEPYRVSLKSLKKNCEYQILYVEEGTMLTPSQKADRKTVHSSVA